MSSIVKIRKGLTIRLHGEAQQSVRAYYPSLFSVQPEDYRVLQPRLLVKEGDAVFCGSPVLQDKNNEKFCITSPVSGVVKQIVRGEKRKLEHIIIQRDEQSGFVDFGKADLQSLNRDTIIEKLLRSGLWTYIHQRPYGVIANPAETPDAIFISGFDTAPLAPDISFVMKQHNPSVFQAGIDVLKKLTPGDIHLNVNPELGIPELFLNTKHIRIHQFTGPHPSGNIGTQLHYIRPVMKGDLIWYLYPQDIMHIGHLFLDGKLNLKRIIALCGSELKETGYLETLPGACVQEVIDGNCKQDNVRVISGNVLTGKNIGKQGFLRYTDTMLSVIPEGDYHEFFGWAKPGFTKFSFSRTFFSWLFPKRKYSLDTNKHGEIRAFVVTGEYERVFPMNIMPVQLLKAILVNDIDRMEELGIYEVVEEDFALCEVICTSKIESQKIIRDGIDTMLKELN